MIDQLLSSVAARVSPTPPPSIADAFAGAVADAAGPNQLVGQAAPTVLNAPQGNLPQPLVLGPAGQNAIRTVFGFDPTQSSEGPVADAFAYGDSDANPLLAGGSTGFADIDTQGRARAFVSLGSVTRIENSGALPDALGTIAAQEVAHKLLASHPDLRGKFSPVESEVIGNAVSLEANEDFLARNLVNTIQSIRNPNYAGIAELQLTALGRVNTALGLGGQGSYDGGADIMNRFMGFVSDSGGSEASITMDTLRDFATAQGVDPEAFVSALGRETRAIFTQTAQALIQRARSQPNF